MRGHSAAEPERRDGINFCWHVLLGEELVYCGRDWQTTLDIARDKVYVVS